MFANDAQAQSAQMGRIAEAVRSHALKTKLIGGCMALAGAGAFFYGVSTLVLYGRVGLVEIAVGVLGAMFLVGGIQRSRTVTLHAIRAPQETRVYRAVEQNPHDIAQLGAVGGDLDGVRVRFVDGEVAWLPVAQRHVEPLMRFLRTRCPHAEPFVADR